jgi:cell surface protein SprA
MIEGMPRTYSGSFNMTTMSIHTAFESMGDVDRGYKSASFDRFLGKLQYFQQKAEALYRGSTYPHGSALAGQPFDPKHGTVGQYSAGVMIPAFLDTYTLSGRDGLSLMPALTALLPNWTIKYAGLAKLPRMKKVFKSFNINHSYKSIYSIGSYNTFTSFQAMNGSHGFITDVTTGLPTPSTMYDMSTVSLNETFSPLAGIDMTFNNNLTAKVEYRKTRALTLSMTSGQITEARSNDLVVGLGYKIADLNLFAPRKAVRMKGDKRSKGKSAKGSEDDSKSNSSSSSSKGRSSSSGGFSQDLNLRFDLTFRNQSGLNRDIMTALTQATSGNRALQISFSADYALSKYLTLTAYYDRQFNKPLLTTSSYPITTQDFGVTVKFVLNR